MTLNQASYLLLSTLKKNGNWVDTPVWFATEGGVHYVFSAGNAGKVKRLRNFSSVKIAPCNVIGKTLGDSIASDAWLLSSQSDIQYAHQALLRKFGWQMRLMDFFSRLSGKLEKRQYIKISNPPDLDPQTK